MAIYIIEADLYKTLTDLDQFDLKVDLPEQDFVTVSGIVRSLDDAGNVDTLYRDGVDLGAAEANAGAVTTDGEWFYDSAADKLTLATTTAPSSLRLEYSPQDWATAKSEAMERASEMFESYLDARYERPLPKTTRSNSSRDYDFYIIKATAILAVLELISGSDPRSPLIATLNNVLFNEAETGIIDMINDGRINFSFEITDSDRSGEILDGSIDDATTGYPTEPTGQATVDHDIVTIKIATGGTLTIGTENTTVTYQVTDSQGVALISATYITGLFQSIGYGIVARFEPGIYTTNDTWTMVIKGLPSKTKFKTITMRR